ncbi:MAG: hypothetical protein RR933_07585, partial [Oscillospiraceae bacterium]
MSIFLKLIEQYSPDAVAVAFDLRAKTFRHKMYDGYKANRKGMPEELAGQMQPLKELLAMLGYTTVTCEGFEADDILGTFADACRKSDGRSRQLTARGRRGERTAHHHSDGQRRNQ